MEAEGIDECVNKSFAHQEPSKTHCPDAGAGAAAANSHPSATACFDCSICLDSAADPVVTLCGHLYCWPCIFKWLQAETTSPQQCPVCKSPLSQSSLVPLCGRGSSNLTAKNKALDIPNRPAGLRSAADEQHLGFNQPMQQQQHYHRYYPSPWGGGTGVFSSTVGGVLGGLAIAILPLVSRDNRGGGGEMYVSRLSRLTTTGNSTSRRERRVEDSLHQIWALLLCCAVLCLLFF